MTERRLKLETGAREEAEYDDTPRGGMFRSTRLMRGWSKWMHGHNCPRCGASCHDRPDRSRHDSWHQDDDQAWDEWTEEMTELKAEIVKLRGQMELMTELLGPALDRVLQERA